MERPMILAQSFRYRGITTTITINQIAQTGTIRYLDKIETVQTTEMQLLKRVAESAIDMEVNDYIYDTSA